MSQLTIGIADMKTSTSPDDLLITYSLGSCIGLTLYDPEACVGGMLHCMLPLSKMDKARAASNPPMFTDTGVFALLEEVYRLGAVRKRLIAKAAGASSLLDDKGLFNIGERNHTVLRKIMWKNNILISAEDVGGSKARTMSLNMRTGRTFIKSGGKEAELE
jgi:chemotaxis protein CheD